jgi:hypothetical protein
LFQESCTICVYSIESSSAKRQRFKRFLERLFGFPPTNKF